MFEKLVALLPYNPSMAHQLAFYGRRMREESAIRRTGVIFLVLAFLVQFFAVLSPPQSTSAASSNDLLNGGISSPADAKNQCLSGVQDYGKIMHYYGITCKSLGEAGSLTIHSDAQNYYSMGRNSYGAHNPSTGRVTDEQPVDIPGAGTLYVRKLNSFGTVAYNALRVRNSDNVVFYILYGCGNLVTVGVPQPPSHGGLIVDNVPPSTPKPTPAPAPAPTPPPPPATQGPPVLGINGVTCAGGITGWASEDEANSSEVIRVDIYVDGQAGSGGVQIGSTNNGGHGYPGTNPSWSFIIPSTYTTTSHNFYIYAINNSNGVTGPGVVGANGPVFGPDPVAGPVCTPPPTPCRYNQNIPATSPECFQPCQYNASIPAGSSQCFQPCTYNPTIPASSAQCFNPCQYNHAIPADSSQCVPPCQYNSTILSNSPQCFQPCQFNPSIAATSPECFQPCQYNNLIAAGDSACKPCEQSLSSSDTLACIAVHKTATNMTAGIADANNTTAHAGDVITYSLYAENKGKATVKGFTFQENMRDVLDYATVSNLHGGTMTSDGEVSWPAQDIAAGQTATVQITIKVKDPIPQTPVDPSDPNHFDMIMTNVYGNTVNIKLPPTPTQTVQTAAAVLPNTGPGTGLFVAAVIVIIGGYFYGRSRLLAKESNLALHDSATV